MQSHNSRIVELVFATCNNWSMKHLHPPFHVLIVEGVCVVATWQNQGHWEARMLKRIPNCDCRLLQSARKHLTPTIETILLFHLLMGAMSCACSARSDMSCWTLSQSMRIKMVKLQCQPAPCFGALWQWQAVVHSIELMQCLPSCPPLKRGTHVNSLHHS